MLSEVANSRKIWTPVESIDILIDNVRTILSGNDFTVYLFGSICYDDFKLGWSDIDILILTEKTLSENQAEQLVNLRQTLLEVYRENRYFRSFEGGILSINEFLNKKQERVVYWGTSGQRITDNYCFDVFSTMQLKDSGILIYGNNIRNQIQYPSYDEIVQAVANHYRTIRNYAVKPGRNLYSIGWMLDIARCLYTLSERKIISKTNAGYWALEKGLVPNVEVMKKVIKIRENPMMYKDKIEVQDWSETLGPIIQEFADVLEKRLLV
ncbi:nucleotidyltransferase domain-containing protein [Anaerocolumna sp. MB42-C2]|uniref:nucleotidyltransferase domain-containing protein n=1 Tax=Anaerocolumna sp. MB42-C2 TaxID=3070997 RepID=UPI0027E0F1F0|nr:nucleotidyltransferase domain-containing protein [Anaerocolumna sp. MB42-C2]WMJ86969.1 nucleotidyltransferase domain-containing protein [Anaerocolumna sp. MB42-C2]